MPTTENISKKAVVQKKIEGNGKIRILIAEDEPLVSQSLRDMLQEIGYQVVGTVQNGLQAVADNKKIFSSQSLDLLFAHYPSFKSTPKGT